VFGGRSIKEVFELLLLLLEFCLAGLIVLLYFAFEELKASVDIFDQFVDLGILWLVLERLEFVYCCFKFQILLL